MRAVALLCVGALAGCHGCTTRSYSDAGDATADASVPDDGPSIVRDAGRLPPWADGSFSVDVTTGTDPGGRACGDAAFLYSGHVTARDTCFQDPWLYASNGTAIRAMPGSLVSQTVLGGSSNAVNGVVLCQTSSLVLQVGDPRSNSTAMLWFQDLAHAGQVIQSYTVPLQPDIPSGIGEIAASDNLVAWVYEDTGGLFHLFVSGPRGEHVHEIFTPLSSNSLNAVYLQANGPHLVFTAAGDIWLYTIDTDTVENLTHDDPAQWAAWVDGNRVAWVDERDAPSGQLDSPNSPQIYAMDLTTRIPQRITFDLAVHMLPVVHGDWIVWQDFRNALNPNPGGYISDRMEIWGYNFVTQQQYPVMTGPILATDPTILDGRVMFGCSQAANPPQIGTFSVPLPQLDGGIARDAASGG